MRYTMESRVPWTPPGTLGDVRYQNTPTSPSSHPQGLSAYVAGDYDSVPGFDYYAPDFGRLKLLTNDRQFKVYINEYRHRVSQEASTAELRYWFRDLLVRHNDSTSAGESARLAELRRKYRGPLRERCLHRRHAHRVAGVAAFPYNGAEPIECRDVGTECET